MATQKKIKIIIADDHPVFRNGMEGALKSMGIISKVSQAANGNEVIKHLEHEPYDIVLMDVKMKPMSGIETTAMITSRFPDTKVIALSMHDDRENILSMLEKGAVGYLIKNADAEEIKKAILDVMAGKKSFSPDVASILYDEVTNPQSSVKLAEDEKLQEERMREVIFLVLHQFTNKEIGEALFRSERTIEENRREIMELIGSKNKYDLFKYATKHAIPEDSELKKKFADQLKDKEYRAQLKSR
jgi:DNA-binding NarL/FixJ family response regulator